MPQPTEHKTVQTRILQYAQDIGWNYAPHFSTEQRLNFTAIKNKKNTNSFRNEINLDQNISNTYMPPLPGLTGCLVLTFSINISSLSGLFKSMLQQLMTGQIRVHELDFKNIAKK